MITQYINKYIIPLLLFLIVFTVVDTWLNSLTKMLIYLIIIVSYLTQKSISIIIGKDRVTNIFFIIFSLFSFIAFFYNPNIQWLNIYFQLLCFTIILNNYHYTPNILPNWLLFISVVGILVQLLVNKTWDYRAFLLSRPDPNYTGYYILLIAILCDVNKRFKAGYCVAALGVFTLSKSYILCIGSYYLLSRFSFLSKKIMAIIKKFHINFFIIVLISFLLVLYVSYNFVSIDPSDLDGGYKHATDKLFSFKNGSNMERTMANLIFLEFVLANPKFLILGIDFEYYLNNIFQVPHNAILLGVLRYGLVFFIYLCVYSRIISSRIMNNIPILIPVVLNIMFLGLGINGIDIILLAIVLASKKYNTL